MRVGQKNGLSDPVFVNADGDLRRDAGLLAGVQGVVDKFFQEDERPFGRRVAGLRR